MTTNVLLMSHHELSMGSSRDTQGSTQPQRTLTAQHRRDSAPTQEMWTGAGSKQSTDFSPCVQRQQANLQASPGIDGNTMGQMGMEQSHGVVGYGQPHGKDGHGAKPHPRWV